MAQIETVNSLTQVVHQIGDLLVKYESETALIEKQFNVLAKQ